MYDDVGIARGKDHEGNNVVALWGKGVSFKCEDFGLYTKPRSEKIQEALRGQVTQDSTLFSGDLCDIVENIRKKHQGCSVAVYTDTYYDHKWTIVVIRNCRAA